MKIVVAVKQVAALDEDFEIRADEKDVDEDFLIYDLIDIFFYLHGFQNLRPMQPLA